MFKNGGAQVPPPIIFAISTDRSTELVLRPSRVLEDSILVRLICFLPQSTTMILLLNDGQC